MKLICILAVIFLSKGLQSMVVPDAETRTGEMPVPMSKLYKKSAMVSSRRLLTPKPKTNGCAMDCMKQMKEDIEKDEQFNQFIVKQSKPYRFQTQFDIAMLKKYCQKMNNTMECVNPCPAGTVKSIASQALSLPKYMCIESKFVEYAPCYGKVSKKMDKLCHSSSRCGPLKTDLEHMMNTQPVNLQEINRLLIGTCKYISCYNTCDKDETTAECGQHAQKTLEGLFSKSMQVMSSMFVTMGFPIELPAECTVISELDGPAEQHVSSENDENNM